MNAPSCIENMKFFDTIMIRTFCSGEDRYELRYIFLKTIHEFIHFINAYPIIENSDDRKFR